MDAPSTDQDVDLDFTMSEDDFKLVDREERAGLEREGATRHQLLLHKWYSASGIGLRWMKMGWADYVADPAPAKTMIQYLELWEKYQTDGVGLALSGPFGTGKTFLSMLLAKELVKRYPKRDGGPSGVFCTYPSEVITMFSAGWRDPKEQKRFEKKIIETPFLFVDDLGKEFASNLGTTTFDQVIRRRVQGLKPTIISTNLNAEEIASRYGGGSLSLMIESAAFVKFAGDDFRPKAKERILEEIKLGIERTIQ